MKKTEKLNIIMSDILTTKPEHLRGTPTAILCKILIIGLTILNHLPPGDGLRWLDWLWRSGYGIQLLQSLQMFFGPLLPC